MCLNKIGMTSISMWDMFFTAAMSCKIYSPEQSIGMHESRFWRIAAPPALQQSAIFVLVPSTSMQKVSAKQPWLKYHSNNSQHYAIVYGQFFWADLTAWVKDSIHSINKL